MGKKSLRLMRNAYPPGWMDHLNMLEIVFAFASLPRRTAVFLSFSSLLAKGVPELLCLWRIALTRHKFMKLFSYSKKDD